MSIRRLPWYYIVYFFAPIAFLCFIPLLFFLRTRFSVNLKPILQYARSYIMSPYTPEINRRSELGTITNEKEVTISTG